MICIEGLENRVMFSASLLTAHAAVNTSGCNNGGVVIPHKKLDNLDLGSHGASIVAHPAVDAAGRVKADDTFGINATNTVNGKANSRPDITKVTLTDSKGKAISPNLATAKVVDDGKDVKVDVTIVKGSMPTNEMHITVTATDSSGSTATRDIIIRPKR